MSLYISNSIKRDSTIPEFLKMGFMLGLATLISWPVLSFYFKPFFHVYLSVFVLPLTIRVIGKPNHSNRLIIISAICFILFIALKIHLLFFTGFCFLVFAFMEKHIGKLNNLPIVLALLLSPFTIYILELIGYPLRIQLANTASYLLQFVFTDIENYGNVIQLNGFEIMVDKACAGLRMITTGIITAIAFCGIYERKQNKTLSYFSIGLLLFVAFVVIVIANLIRILILILFQSPPETFGHELIGMVTYVGIILPALMLLAYLWTKWFGKVQSKISNSDVNTKKQFIHKVFLLAVITMLLYTRFNYSDFLVEHADESFKTIRVDGFSNDVLNNGVLKLNSQDVLIYLKPAQPFYSADHTPLICWRGSGYTFKSEEVVTVEKDFQVNMAQLVKDDDLLFTAWFYDNKTEQTHNHFTWRWLQIKGSDGFRLVNITSNTKENLICELKNFSNYDI